MSLLGAMSTAISGLSAQSASFGNISDNIANSQTVGFKRIGTNFEDILTSSTAGSNQSGSVLAKPDYQNTLQGTIAQNSNPLSMAIAGQGFFPISLLNGGQVGTVNFSPQQYYTRAGDFTMDKSGFLVNGAGGYLNGWPINPQSGQINRTTLAPIQVTQSVYNPVATSIVDMAANLPATPATGVPINAQVSVYDTLGTSHIITLGMTQTAPNVWTVAVNSPDDATGVARGTATVNFGPTASGNPVADGTVGSITSPTGSVSGSAFAANNPASLSFATDFGNGPQTIALNFGTYGKAAGLTQYAGTTFQLQGINQNGVPQGSFSSASVTSAGDIQVNYNNGQVRTIARVPITIFSAADELQRQNGSAFTATVNSGQPLNEDAGINGAGLIKTSATETSNVDIATEFSNLIVAQQAYSANAKIVTSADQLLQTTLNMKQ
ncbi:MAG: flagellar hook protein FlgE [Acetobacteraceae bacterium]|nr:flagellar hook protein FlgE [Acetobacteraceae bacterium]